MFKFSKKQRPKRYINRKRKPTSRSYINSFRIDRGKIFRGFFISLVFTSVLAGGQFLYKGLCQAVFFKLTGITVQGCEYIDKDTVIELSGLDNQTNLLSLDLKTVILNLTTNKWINDAEVTRDWPNRITINIKERRPIAIANLVEGFYYVDNKGMTFAEVTPGDDIDFPVISWPKEMDDSLSTDNALTSALDFLKLADKGNSILPCQNISELKVTEEGEIVLFLLDSVFPIYFDSGDIKQTYCRLAKILKELYKNQEISKVAFIRMNYMQNKVLVSMEQPHTQDTRS